MEGGSWALTLSGLVVLGLQLHAYGYVPSALPDSNCFGQSTEAAAGSGGYLTLQAQAPRMAAAPTLSSTGASKVPLLLLCATALPRTPRAHLRA